MSCGTCMNGRLSIFCALNNCPFGGLCGNGIDESPDVELRCAPITQARGLVATAPIASGTVVGEYLGEWKIIPRHTKLVNSGYTLRLKSKAKHHPSDRVYVDASTMGSIMRFVNHSCVPNAYFHEVGNGRRHGVVVATCRDIKPHEEVTVDYGKDNLWFVCKCGEADCCHRDVKDSLDTHVYTRANV